MNRAMWMEDELGMVPATGRLRLTLNRTVTARQKQWQVFIKPGAKGLYDWSSSCGRRVILTKSQRGQ